MSLTVAPPDALAAAPPRSAADRWMRRLLRLPLDAPPGTAAGAHKAFQTSMLIATVRCGLMYIVFPFVLPALGIASGVGPVIGFAVNLVAIVCITLSLRRFFRADHPKRWWYAALGGSVMFLLIGLVVADIAAVA